MKVKINRWLNTPDTTGTIRLDITYHAISPVLNITGAAGMGRQFFIDCDPHIAGTGGAGITYIGNQVDSLELAGTAGLDN